MDHPADQVTGARHRRTDGRAFAILVYVAAFVTGAIVMSFEMLGSRYLNPFFGSGIYTWASLISTVLAALTAGYFLGGTLADRHPSVRVLGTTVLVGSGYLVLLPLFSGTILDFILSGVDDIKLGSLASALAIMAFPVICLGMYSPFAIRLLLDTPQRSGSVSGAVYGISTAGSIVGTLGTTFLLIPSIGTRTLTISLGIIGLATALALMSSRRLATTPAGALLIGALVALPGPPCSAEELFDPTIRAAMLAQKDGQVAHVETEYNDIFVAKQGVRLTMSFQLKGWDYTESVTNLEEPDDLPVLYTRMMTVGLVYPDAPNTILMLGLGGGSISTYLGRFMPDIAISTVEIDAGVIAVAKTHFGLRETARVKFLEGDGRVFLNRNRERYDLIVVDAFHGGYVPFHLLTREFYELLKQRLAPGGAAVFNVHDATKLYASTVKTLRSVFATVDLYPTGAGEVATVVTDAPRRDAATLGRRAAALQDKYGFRFPLPALVARRLEKPDVAGGELLTDDFAPVHYYDTIGRPSRRRQ